MGVELLPELVRRANAVLDAYDMPWIEVRQGNQGNLGLREEAPFDRILVSAEADYLPESLMEQMRQNGIMVIPVRGELLRVEKRPDDVVVTRHGPFSFVPLL